MKRMMRSAAIAMAMCGVGIPAAYAETILQTYESAPSGSTIVIERSPRSVYLDEMGRPYVEVTTPAVPTLIVAPVAVEVVSDRWDGVTHDDRGMTPAEISHLTGKVDSSTAGLPKSGAGVQPGNMGPANSKGQ